MINILWDASHIWGYLLLHAVKATGIPFRVLKGLDIAHSGLTGKMLIVPGGSARRKFEALGAQGTEAIHRFVKDGGHYMGFCGGAGLALSGNLGLCPWKRDGMPDRMQHLVSGHLVCEVSSGNDIIPASLSGKPALLPVWCPGRFDEPADRQGVEVLARYRAAGPDLYVADMPYSSMPGDILAEWSSMYGVNLRPSILDGKPCAVMGELGRGSWLLSYSHLETPGDGTPGSDHASRWFLHILRSGAAKISRWPPCLRSSLRPCLFSGRTLTSFPAPCALKPFWSWPASSVCSSRAIRGFSAGVPACPAR
ncbi:MAG: hypothetical protein IKL01_06000, partial [Mailhella sp.]|nr:hypothetical protein [Mailhella sp.]